MTQVTLGTEDKEKKKGGRGGEALRRGRRKAGREGGGM